MDSLSGIREACSILSDTKITARKKGESGLRDLLNNPGIVSALHVASASGDAFSWRNVYSAAFSFLRLEAEKIKTDGLKEKQAKNAYTLRSNRKREVISLFRLVIKKAGKGLRWHTVVSNLISLLDNEFTKSLFVDDILKMLNDVVSNPTCQSVLSVSEDSHQWELILQAVTSLLYEAPDNLDNLTALKLLNSTIKHGGLVCDLSKSLLTPRMFRLVTGLLTAANLSARPDSPAKLEAISVATNFCSAAALDFRREVCKLGEETVHCVIPSWDERNPSTNTALQFINLVVKVHHPGGARTESCGAMFFNSEQWRHQLIRLHQNIVDTTIRNKLRQNKSRGSRLGADYELSEDLLDLSVSVLRQTLSKDGGPCNVTQLAPLDDTQAEGQPAKRARLDSSARDVNALDTSFRAFIEHIQAPADNDLTKIPWVQILASLLTRFPDMFDKELRKQVLRVLSALLQSTKTVWTKQHCLAACLNLLAVSGMSQVSDWEVVARTTFNLVSMNQAGTQGHKLFQMILATNSSLYSIDQVYSLFTNHLVKLGSGTMSTLLYLLKNHTVNPSTLGQSWRECLVYWLFPDLQEEATGAQGRADPRQFADILISLVLTKVDKSAVTVVPRSSISQLEQDLLTTNHANPLIQHKEAETGPEPCVSGSLIVDLAGEVEKLLIKEVATLMAQAQVEEGSVRAMLKEAALLISYSHNLNLRQVKKTERNETSKLEYMTNTIVKKSAELSIKLFNKTKNKSSALILSVVEGWTELLSSLGRLPGFNPNALYSEEVNLGKLMDKVMELVTETCTSKQTRLENLKPTQNQGVSGHNPFDEFDEKVPSSSETQAGAEVDNFSLDLNSLDKPEEEKELTLAHQSIQLLVLYYAPRLGLESREVGKGQDAEKGEGQIGELGEGQVGIVDLMLRVLVVYEHSRQAQDAVIHGIISLVASRLLTKEAVDKLAEIVMVLAKTSMAKNTFDQAGMTGVLRVIENLVEPAVRLESRICGNVISKFMRVLPVQNSRMQFNRFSATFTLQLITTIHSLDVKGGPDWTQWDSKVHNHTATLESSLGLDSDEPIPIGRCLPRFLCHPSQLVRLNAARMILGSPDFDHQQFVSSVLPKILDEDLFQTCSYKELAQSEKMSRMNAALMYCSALMATDTIYTRYSISKILCLTRQHSMSSSLEPVIGLISQQSQKKGETKDVLEPILPEIFYDFITKKFPYAEFPIHLFGFSVEKFNNFLSYYEKEIVPMILLNSPNNQTLLELGDRLKLQAPSVIERNLLMLIQFSFPGLVAKEFGVLVLNKENMSKLGDLVHNYYRDEFAKKVFNNAPSLISFTFSHINDSKELQRDLHVDKYTDIKAGPLDFNYELAQSVIDYLKVMGEEDIYDKLCARNPMSIPEICVDLCLNLHADHKQSQLRCLHSLFLWLKNILSDNSRNILSALPFLFTFISQQLLIYISRTEEKDCKTAALLVLDGLVTQIMSCSIASVQNCVVELNTCLISIIMDEKNPETAEKARHILEFLIVENTDHFSNIEGGLEEYPTTEMFSTLSATLGTVKKNQSLNQFIENFMMITKRVEVSFCKNLLNQLNSRLDTSSYEFAGLVESNNNLVDSLVKQLLRISKTDDQSISTLAMDCLSRIGPVEISASSNISPAAESADPSSPASAYVVPILENMRQLLKHSSSSLTKDAFGAIVGILSSTTEGRELNFDNLDRELAILRPLRQKGKKNLNLTPVLEDEKRFKNDLDDPALWSSPGQSYANWIKVLVHKFLNCMSERSVLGLMKVVCKESEKLCELIFPFIVHECLLHSNADIRSIISFRICSFFKEYYDYSTSENDSRASTPSLGHEVSVHMDKQKVLLMVNAVKYIRLRKLPHDVVQNSKIEDWDRNFWVLGLDYIHVAQAALACGDYLSALTYVDIWVAEYQLTNAKDNTILANINKQEPKKCKVLRKIVSAACSKIGLLDHYEGIKAILTEPVEIETKLENIPILDIKATQTPGDREALITGLYESGMFHLLSQYLNNLSQQDATPFIKDIQAECSWRLGEWDKAYTQNQESSFNENLFTSLQSHLNTDREQVESSTKLLQLNITKDLSNINIETSFEIYSILAKLKQIGELKTLTDEHTEETLSILLGDLSRKDDMYYTEFSKLEPTYSMRLSLLEHVAANLKIGQRITAKESLKLCQKARESSCFGFCNRVLEKMGNVDHLLDFKFEEAKLEWGRGSCMKGIQLAKNLEQEIGGLIAKGPDAQKILPELLVTLGQWVDHTKSEPSNTVISRYYKKAVDLLKADTVQDEKSLLEAHLGLAKLTDHHYRKVEEYMQGVEFKERKENTKALEDQVKILASVNDKDKNFKHAFIQKQRFMKIDQQEIERCENERSEHLYTSVENYLSVLKHGENTIAMYRVISLWFANQDDPHINNLMRKALPQIPSYRLVPLLYQMAARMDEFKKKDDNDFRVILYNTIYRCALDHPHHALPIIFAMKYANLDENYSGKAGNKKTEPDNGRTKCALKLISEMSKTHRDLIDKYSNLTLSLVEVAYEAVVAKEKGYTAIKSSSSYVKIKNWANIIVPTLTIPVRPDKDYSSYPGIARFEPRYSLVGGINAPKRTECLGTDGVIYPQLLKGMDDMRQDAVMQQVFALTNTLLDKDGETRNHNLKIRTYKVVPLSQRSGILQWCKGTKPLQSCLIGEDGVHPRYFPAPYLSFNNCQKHYKNQTQDTKHFEQICRQFPPAMKFFFMETFPSPEMYQKAKSSYTKSVAASSMVGHILGLGDRHLNNILMDQATGEIVHIDFGIAFDKGKILPTPELVPFRLTNDIVDGFGPTGVEGVFRKNCERTMRVLRENKDNLLTVLEVLVHDPLCDWSVGPSKAAAKQTEKEWEKLQKREDGQGNRMAERALRVLVSKLEGREDGSPLSISGQVGSLIQHARNPDHLSRIYIGWSPWC